MCLRGWKTNRPPNLAAELTITQTLKEETTDGPYDEGSKGIPAPESLKGYPQAQRALVNFPDAHRHDAIADACEKLHEQMSLRGCLRRDETEQFSPRPGCAPHRNGPDRDGQRQMERIA